MAALVAQPRYEGGPNAKIRLWKPDTLHGKTMTLTSRESGEGRLQVGDEIL